MFCIEPLAYVPLNYAALQITTKFKQACRLSGSPVTNTYLLNVAPMTAEWNKWSNVLPQFTKTPGLVATSTLDDSAKLAERKCWGIEFRQWPQVAKKWPTRDRPSGWLSADAVGQITDGGFHMVPVGVSDNKELRQVEWRYSFAVAEKALARHHISASARKAYIYLKLLHQHFFSDPAVISTHYLKYFFFWLLEIWPPTFWSDNKMAAILLRATDELIQCVKRRDLRHYFISDVNLFADLPPTFASDVGDGIARVRHNLVACLLEIDDCVTFVGLQDLPKASVQLAGPIRDMTEEPCSAEQFNLSRRAGLDVLAGGVVDVLCRIGAQQASEEDPGDLLQLRIRLNTFVRVAFSIWRKQYRLGMRTLFNGDSLLQYVLERLILSRLPELVICKALRFMQADADCKQMFLRNGTTMTPSDAYARFNKSYIAQDIRSKLGVTISMLELMGSDIITDNAALYKEVNDHPINS